MANEVKNHTESRDLTIKYNFNNNSLFCGKKGMLQAGNMAESQTAGNPAAPSEDATNKNGEEKLNA